MRYATPLGPFSRAVDELGNAYRRGMPQAVLGVAQLLKLPPFQRLLLLTEKPVSLAVTM